MRLLQVLRRGAVAALCLALVLLHPPAAVAAVAPKLPIDRQVEILWQATEEILAANPEAAAQVRLLGVGSWMSGKATSASDVDVTLGHPNPATEKRLAGQIQARVEQLAAEAGGGHEVLVTYRNHHLFRDRFRGEAGQAFVAEYADQAAAGEGTFAYRPGPDGKLVRSRIATERFWMDQGLKVPAQVTRAYTFVEDSVVFMERMAAEGKPIAVQAEKAAKYLNNYETFLKGRMGAQWGDISSLESLPPKARQWMDGMLRYKQTVARLGKEYGQTMTAEAAEAAARRYAMLELREFMGIAGQAELEREMGRFVANTTDYLVRAADDVTALEGAFKFRMADRARSAEALLKLQNSIKRVLGRSLLHGFEAYLIMQTYYEQGAEAALQTTLTIAAMHAVPVAGLVALAGELAKDLFVGAATYAGQALIFDPINNYWLKEWAFNDDSPVYIFGRWAGSGDRRMNSPFAGRQRETLACVYADRLGLLDQHMDLYLQKVKDWRGGKVATAGAGSVRPALRQRLRQDLARSERMLSIIDTLSLRLAGGLYEEVDPPLDLLVNGIEDSTVEALIGPDGRLKLDVRVNARFGQGEILPADKGTVRDYFCANGLKATREWLEANKLAGYRQVYELNWEVIVQTPGWQVEDKPVGDIQPGEAGLASRRFSLGFRRVAQDAGELDATLRLSTAYWQGEELRRFEKRIHVHGQFGAGSLVLNIVDEEGRPLRGASVHLDGERDYAARSGPRGEATIDAMLPGSYALVVSAKDYQTFEARQNVALNQVAERKVTLSFLADAALELRVLDESDDSPIGGASVAMGGPLNLSAQSDADGWLRFDALRPGSYSVEVSAAGYQTASGTRRIAARDRLKKSIKLTPLAEAEQKPKIRPEPEPAEPKDPKPTPRPSAVSDCWEGHRQKVDNALAANSDGDGGHVVLFADPACKAEHDRCNDKAFEEGVACRGKAKTVADSQACNDGVSRGWERCAYQEVQCSAGHLRRECGVQATEPEPPADEAALQCWEKHRQTVENALKANSDGDGGHVYIHATPQCKAAHDRCSDEAYEKGRLCRSKSNTAEGQKACNDGVSRGWERCAYEEVQCSAAALKRECGVAGR